MPRLIPRAEIFGIRPARAAQNDGRPLNRPTVSGGAGLLENGVYRRRHHTETPPKITMRGRTNWLVT